jgi:hypothetical protein
VNPLRCPNRAIHVARIGKRVFGEFFARMGYSSHPASFTPPLRSPQKTLRRRNMQLNGLCNPLP